MTHLLPFHVRPDDLVSYLRALTDALDSTGPVLAPYANQAPELPEVSAIPDGLALVISTSGSTGVPKRAMLTRDALIASADATLERLSGPGQWLLSMPAHHIAGIQVLIRSIRSGFDPVQLTTFSIEGFVRATDRLIAPRRYTSLVPTQLSWMLDAGEESRAALSSYDAILLGGAPSPSVLLVTAREAHIHVLTTYGMSETAGGCVYDGTPLTPTGVNLADDGRITLTGATVAAGYLANPDRTATAFGRTRDGIRTFRTNDIGTWQNRQLHVLGRIDDLINTGGLKVAPRIVEEAATGLSDVREAVALGLPDDEWGHVVGLAVRARKPLQLQDIRDYLREYLPSYALPRKLLLAEQLPLRGPGKPDRVALAETQGWQTLPVHT